MTLRYFGFRHATPKGMSFRKKWPQMLRRRASDRGQPLRAGVGGGYQDGIGWIPMELTPGLGEMLEQKPEKTRTKEIRTMPSRRLSRRRKRPPKRTGHRSLSRMAAP